MQEEEQEDYTNYDELNIGDYVSFPEETKPLVPELIVEHTSEQLTFIEAPFKPNSPSIILSATAGSGKTKCLIARLKYLLANGVDPKKIICFSFTTAAVGEIKARLGNDDIKVTTIHSFCMSLLGRMKKMKKVATFYDFIKWYKEHYKPKIGSYATKQKDIDKFYADVEKLYDNADYLASEISAFKLQSAENMKTKVPDFWLQYSAFLKLTKSMDFSDMLILTKDALKEQKYLSMAKSQFAVNHLFIDEFQDSSVLQAKILQSVAPSAIVYLLGDKAQSIYGFSNANCDAVIDFFKKRKQIVEMTLSINFRSKKSIVENSNKYTNLQAKSNSNENGFVERKIILFEDLVELLKKDEPITILARTNAVIRDIEKRLIIMKMPNFRFFNFLKENEILDLKSAKERISTKKKINELLPYFGNSLDNIIKFVEDSRGGNSTIRTIHAAKGLEFKHIVVCNSISPEMLEENGITDLPQQAFEQISFNHDDEDKEPMNIHYVAVSRGIDSNRFLLYEN